MSAPNLTWCLPRSHVRVFELLELLGVLELRHEVRRAEPDVAVDVDADDAAGDARIVGHAVEADLRPCRSSPNGSWLPSLVPRAYEKRASLTRLEPSTLVQPPTTRVRVEEVAAPGRGRRAVEDAAEPARHEAEAVAADVAREQVVALPSGMSTRAR